MIASENFVPRAILEAAGSVLTNKYAEGLPGKRYYGGCEWVDVSEQLAIDRAKELFGAEHANVQPHAGAQANNAAYMALIEPGRHDPRDGAGARRPPHARDEAERVGQALQGRRLPGAAARTTASTWSRSSGSRTEHRPKVIVAGWSAYPRHLDFAEFRRIADEVGAKLFVDMAHFAGLVAAGEHPSPVPHADVVTTTTHKTLCGPRAGLILCKEEYAQAIDKAVFPGQQGGPLEHIIAAKAVCLRIARERAVPRAPAPDDRERAGARRGAPGGRARRAHRRHRRAPRARRPRDGRPQRQGGGGPPRRGRHHGQPQRDPVRPAPADAGVRACGSARRRSPRAAWSRTTCARSAR